MTEKKKELAPIDQNQDPFLALFKGLAENPDIPVDKMKQIIDMQEHILDRNQEQAFNFSMAQAQALMPIVPLDKKNNQTQSRYASYENMLKHTKPIYTEAGFSVMFYEEDAKADNDIRICVDIMHKDGHTKKRYVDVPIDDKGIKGSVNKTGTHAKGSSISYGRSYLMKMIFNIPTGDDDDGNGAGSPTITEDQVNELDAMIKENGLDKDPKYVPRMLKFLKVESLDLLPAQDFKKAKAAFEAGIKANKGDK